jgi:polysaccharide export outer membrane protein
MIKILITLFISLFIYSCGLSSETVSKEKKDFIDNLNKSIKPIDMLGVNDLIEIRVYGETELTRVYRINTSGSITFPIAGKIKVIDRSINELTKEIEKRLKTNFFKNPQVTIFLKESNSRNVYILGEVKKPGVYSYNHKLTLLKLIATSGGLTNIADISKIILKREIDGKINSITIDASLIIKGLIGDLLLSPEDIIYVSESWL